MRRVTTRSLAELGVAVPDLNDVAAMHGHLFVRDAVGMAGVGEAARVPIDDATAFLGTLPHDSTVDGAAPVAIGTVPFVPGSPGDLVVPEVTVRKHADGRAWVTWFDDADPVAALRPAAAPVPSAAAFGVASQASHAVEPVSAENVPGSQSEHSPAPAAL